MEEEEEEDFLNEPLDGWSETEDEWEMAVKMKDQEVSDRKNRSHQKQRNPGAFWGAQSLC